MHCSNETFMFVTDGREVTKNEKKRTVEEKNNPSSSLALSYGVCLFVWSRLKAEQHKHCRTVDTNLFTITSKNSQKFLNIYEKWPNKQTEKNRIWFSGVVLQCSTFHIAVCLHRCFDQLYTFGFLNRSGKLEFSRWKTVLIWVVQPSKVQ